MELIYKMVKYSIDKKVKFLEKGHKYKRKDGSEYCSVTTLVKKYYPVFDTNTIAKYKALSMTKKGVKTTATELKKQWKAKAKESTDRGSLVHKEIEMYIDNNSLLSLAEVLNPLSVRGMEYLSAKLITYDEPRVVSEIIVYDDNYSIAGTIDCVIFYGDRKAVIIDWKTNKEIEYEDKYKKRGIHFLTSDRPNCNYTHYSHQLNIYTKLLEKMYNVTVTHLFIAHLTEEGVVEIPVVKELDYTTLLLEEYKKW